MKAQNIISYNPPSYPYGINIDNNYTGNWMREFSFSKNGTGKLFSFGAYGSATSLYYGYIGGNSTSSLASPWMVFLPNGNVGINTTNPHELLSVNGTILAKQVKVSTQAADWPDYVFSKNYNLKNIYDIESFIKTNKHLPDVPSAKSVEENGVDLGKMNKILLQKVEELTLYLIQQQKEIDILKANSTN